MADIETRVSVADQRKSFIDQVRAQEWDNREIAINLARRMVIDMASGAQYDVDDFLFAASLGRSHEYPKEHDTLHTLSELRPGRLVGVIRDKKLQNVGITDKIPFSMRVYLGPTSYPDGQQYNRETTATLNLAVAVRRAREDSRVPAIDVEFNDQPVSVPVLESWTEPQWPSAPFHEPNTLLVGSEELLGHIARGDELGTKQMSILLTHLAKIAQAGL